MTAIIALIHEDTVHVGTDTAATIGEMTRTLDDSKVFVKSNMLWGVAGPLRLLQLIKYTYEIPLKEDGLTDMAYICHIVANHLQIQHEEFVATKDESGSSYFSGEILICYNKRIYEIDSRFSVLRSSDNYHCIGSGLPYAYGSLYTTDIPSLRDKPKMRIELALKAAAKYTNSVKAPYVFFEHKL